MEWMKLVHGTAQPTPLATFGTGDEVRVWYRILEQEKERFGQFEGTVIRLRGSGPSRTFTVRRVTYGEGVERIFPLDAKTVSKIEVLRRGRVKRSRLYFLRRAIGKTRIESARISSTTVKPPEAVPVVSASADAQPAAEKPETVAAAEKPTGSDKPTS